MRPTVAELATQVVAALPAGTPVTRVVVDSSLFSGPLTASGWGPADAPSSYAAPVTATAVDGARVSPGSLARSGQPGIDAGSALADALGAHGATVVLGEAPEGAETLATVQSAPIARLVEQMLCAVGQHARRGAGPPGGARPRVPGQLRGWRAGGHRGPDRGRGRRHRRHALRRQRPVQDDRVPASVLAAVLHGAADGSIEGASGLLSGLPVAGYDGTLFDRGDDDPATAPGTVRAKTGTLLGVHALAGTAVTADGRLLAFAVVADGATGSEVAAEAVLDDIAATLAGCGCR